MSTYFGDSSGVVKLYVTEIGSEWVDGLTDQAQGHQVVIARITLVEVAAALFRRVRGGTLSASDAARAIQELGHDLTSQFVIVDLTPTVVAKALILAEQYGLRGYDCVQLASALVVQRERLERGLSPLTLISSDVELNHAARKEHLQVEDPNTLP
ncbi:MAG: type II toxin-antitoxin system VapC family toxin [Chloroflexota bacterium]